MKKCDSNLLFFALGAAVGAAVAYVMASDKKDKIVHSFNELINKIKSNGKSTLSKGEDVLDQLIENED